jgi:RNA polymerase sigma-70 factor (ECF subfamily)
MAAGEITRLLCEIRDGNRKAENELVAILYPDLHKIAAKLMSRERSDHTLQTTALLHQAYLRLVEGKPGNFKDRAQFLGFAAHIMRNILIDHARARCAQRRGGPRSRGVSLEGIDVFADEHFEELLMINDALSLLSKEDSRAARVLESHVFGELSIEEIAVYIGTSPRTVKRDLSFAKAWVYQRLYSSTE